MFAQHLTNSTTTLNGAKSNKSSLNPVLDLFSMGISSDKSTQYNLISSAFKTDPILTLKCIFYLRDVRNGQGNRDIFRTAMSYLIPQDTNLVIELLPYIPEIGRWKDVYELYNQHPKLDTAILSLVTSALTNKDTLCAKWFPRQSKFHKDLANHLNIDIGQLRRQVTHLTKVVETQMCTNQWHKIIYEHVPSIANLKYNKAFFRNDLSRRQEYLEKVMSGETTANSSVSYPHEILHLHEAKNDTKTANALWTQLPNYMPQDSEFNILPVIDTSNSMYTKAKGTHTSCLAIAASLGIYMAERNTGTYKNLWVNFSDIPSAYYLKGETLSQKVASLDYRNWGNSTNIDALMQMVLQSAKRYPKDAPKAILIVSDMEFNGCTRYTAYEKFKQDFAKLNLELPTIIFWRVNTLSKQQPVILDDKKTMLINGYSPVILKEILKGNILDYSPYEAMKAVLEPKYPFIDEIYS